MTIQETIIEAFKASQAALTRATAAIASLRTEKSALEAEVTRLHAQVASFKSTITHLEAESVKIVEPASVQTLLANLLQSVEETNQAAATRPSHPRSVITARRDEVLPTIQETHNEEPATAANNHLIRSLQSRRTVERNGSFPEALDVTQ